MGVSVACADLNMWNAMNIAKWLRWIAVNEEKDSSDSDWKCIYDHGYNYIVIMVNLNDNLI